MAGYNRTGNPFVDGAIIEANDFDIEFTNLDIAFGTSGHNHDNTDGNGPQINTVGLADNAVTGEKINSATTITAASFVGPLTGAVTGNVTGNLTGNVVGNLDADSATIDSLTITSGTAITSIDTDLSSVSASDDTLASAKAIKAYVDSQVAAENELTEMNDVTITSVTDNEVLAYDSTSSKWINQTAVEAGLQPNDAGLTSIAGLTTAANKMIYTTGSDTYAVTDLSAYGRTLIDDADAAAARTTLGLGTAATTASTAYATAAQGTKADNALPKAGGTMTGNITFNSTQTFDGRDVSEDGTKLDGIEEGADVTDTANVTAAGALMDSEVTNLAQVKAFSSADYATAAQGTTADSALQPADNISELTNDSGYITGNQTITLSGDAEGSGTTAITVALAANTVGVSELNLTDGTAGQFLKTDGSGTISFADAPTSFTTLEVEPTADHAIFSLRNTASNTFEDSRSYHEIQWDAKDLGGVDVTYAEIEGRTHATGSRGSLNLSVKGASGLEPYLILAGDDQRIEAVKNIRFNSGNGIDFSATGDGSATMSNELFDDYEEGTWTPALSTTSPFNDFTTATIDVISCTYTKVGKLVTIQAQFHTENIVLGTASGLIVVTGLPYVPAGSSYGVCHANSFAGNAPTMAVTSSSYSGVVFRTLTSLAGATSQIDADDLTTGVSDSNFFRFTITYEV